MCIYIYIYMKVYTHVFTSTCTYIHAYRYTYIYISTYGVWLVFKDEADVGMPLGTDLNFGKVRTIQNPSSNFGILWEKQGQPNSK